MEVREEEAGAEMCSVLCAVCHCAVCCVWVCFMCVLGGCEWAVTAVLRALQVPPPSPITRPSPQSKDMTIPDSQVSNFRTFGVHLSPYHCRPG